MTKTGVRTYFKGHPIEMAHLMSERFAWSLFFTAKMEANQGEFDLAEFIAAVVPWYHDELFFLEDLKVEAAVVSPSPLSSPLPSSSPPKGNGWTAEEDAYLVQVRS